MIGWLVRKWTAKREAQEDAILAHLLEHGECLGSALYRAKVVSRVDVYLVLMRMEKAKLVQSRENPGDMERLGAVRRLYKLDKAGIERLRKIRHPATQPLHMVH